MSPLRPPHLKKYNAEIHSQSAIEGMIGLMAEGGVTAAGIERIRIDIFDVAHLPRARLDSVVKAVRHLEKISIRNLDMHLV